MWVRTDYNMIKRFIYQKLPKRVAVSALSFIKTPVQARTFCNGFASCPEALQNNSIEDLVENPYLWKPANVATEEQSWIEEAYPKNIEYDTEEIKSVIACVKCNLNQVEYYEKQIRGADEPMSCFCFCRNCGKRWTQ